MGLSLESPRPVGEDAGREGATERRFQLFVDALPALAWMANADGWITWYNRRWYDYTGTTPEQMEGWGWQSVHDPAVLPSVMERWGGSIATGDPFQMVFPLRGGDGIFRSFLTRVLPVRDEAGAVLQWVGTNTEVDELQRTQEALEASEQELRYTLELNPQIHWTADAWGRVLDFSPRWLEVTGLSRAEALGEGWVRAQHPEDRPRMLAEWQRCLDLGEPYDLEHRIATVDGQYGWRRTRAYPRRNASGAIVKWYGTTEDIDGRKKAQEALVQSAERLRLALSAARGMGTFDWNLPENRLLLDEPLSGLFWIDPVRAASGVPISAFFDLLHGEDRERVGAAVAEAIATGNEYRADYRVVGPGGAMRWIAARGVCHKDERGEPWRFLGVCLDITERKLTEQALIQNEKLAAVGRLAASIAHEINNPLEAVTNLLYLTRQCDLSAEALGYLETADQELRRVTAIAGHTLRFHRQSSRATLASCQELFSSVLSLYHGRLQNVGIQVEKRKRAERKAMCFEGEIRQVLSNLIGNAIDALQPQGGRLLLRSREATRWSTGVRGLMLTVADTGAGIPPEVLHRVFEPFFTTKEASGTGLGLWISREIVERHRGTLRVRSSRSAARHGTVFAVFLPSGE